MVALPGRCRGWHLKTLVFVAARGLISGAVGRGRLPRVWSRALCGGRVGEAKEEVLKPTAQTGELLERSVKEARRLAAVTRCKAGARGREQAPGRSATGTPGVPSSCPAGSRSTEKSRRAFSCACRRARGRQAS
jgi:hypothetical protein